MYEVIFSLGDWKLRTMRFEKVQYKAKPLKYVVAHRCSIQSTYQLAWLTTDNEAVCCGCKTAVPDEIQTLMVLLV